MVTEATLEELSDANLDFRADRRIMQLSVAAAVQFFACPATARAQFHRSTAGQRQQAQDAASTDQLAALATRRRVCAGRLLSRQSVGQPSRAAGGDALSREVGCTASSADRLAAAISQDRRRALSARRGDAGVG